MIVLLHCAIVYLRLPPLAFHVDLGGETVCLDRAES
jgi:hypothetical protein